MKKKIYIIPDLECIECMPLTALCGSISEQPTGAPPAQDQHPGGMGHAPAHKPF